MKIAYLVAAIGEWNRDLYDRKSTLIEGGWDYVSTPDELEKYLSVNDPKYIFFPHWRWIVPPEIVNKYDCVCFHMTDLPYGRGGSPLQNLIQRGHKMTVLTALKMDQGTDSGPVYFKEQLSLEGSAKEIYCRSAELIWDMIIRLIKENPIPNPQAGEVVAFKRRKPIESVLPELDSLEKTYDFIRMLDAPGYPHAFIEVGSYVIYLTDAKLNKNELSAIATIKLKEIDNDNE